MADISDDIEDWSATAANNAPAGATTIGTGLDDNLRAIQAAVAAWKADLEPRLRGYLFGLTLSNNGSDATNDIDIAAGGAMDSTGVNWMALGSALTKRLDAAWAVGTGNGGLDTGSIANTTYHVWLIKRSDTGVVDALFSTSATAPTMPANYDYKRRIGSILRESAAIVAFVQDGDEFTRNATVTDVAAASQTSSASTRTLSVPTGIRVKAKFIAHVLSTELTKGIRFSDLSVSDEAAGTATTSHLAINVQAGGGSNVGVSGSYQVYTNTSGQIRSRGDATHTLTIVTEGWIDRRGRDA